MIRDVHREMGVVMRGVLVLIACLLGAAAVVNIIALKMRLQPAQESPDRQRIRAWSRLHAIDPITMRPDVPEVPGTPKLWIVTYSDVNRVVHRVIVTCPEVGAAEDCDTWETR